MRSSGRAAPRGSRGEAGRNAGEFRRNACAGAATGVFGLRSGRFVPEDGSIGRGAEGGRARARRRGGQARQGCRATGEADEADDVRTAGPGVPGPDGAPGNPVEAAREAEVGIRRGIRNDIDADAASGRGVPASWRPALMTPPIPAQYRESGILGFRPEINQVALEALWKFGLMRQKNEIIRIGMERQCFAF